MSRQAETITLAPATNPNLLDDTQANNGSMILASLGTGDVTITLPTNPEDGQHFYIKRAGPGNIFTVDPGASPLDPAFPDAASPVTNGDVYHLKYEAAADIWHVIGCCVAPG